MADTSLARRALTGAGWLIGWRMVSRTLGFLSTLVLARLLVPADFGLVAMATTFSGAIDSLSQFSVEDVLVRRVEDDTRLHDAAFTLQVGRAVLTGGLIAAGAPWAAAWFHEPRLIPVLLVLGALSALAGFENIGLVAFRRELRFDVQFKISLIPRVLQVLTTIAVAWEWRTYWALLVGMAVTRVVRLVMTYAAHPYRPRFSLDGWRDLAGFSAWLWGASLARLVWDRIENIAIGPRFGAGGLGLYQIAGTVAVLPTSELVAPASDVLLAGLSFAQRKGSRATEEALLLGLALLLLVGPIGLTMSAGAADVVRVLLGTQWTGAQSLISVIALGSLWAPLGYVSRAALVATGKVRQEFTLMAIAAGIKAMVIWAAVNTNNLTAVAAATLLCSLIETLAFVKQSGPRGTGNRKRALGGALRLAAGGAASAIALAKTGLGWAPVSIMRPGLSGLMQGFAHLAILGVVAVAAFWGSVAALWFLLGRPEGPEAILARLGRSALGRRANPSPPGG